jgi:hypothetical protein
MGGDSVYLAYIYKPVVQMPAAEAGGAIPRLEAPAADAAPHRVHRGEDADQLAGALPLRLHEGLRRLLALRALQSNQVPGERSFSTLRIRIRDPMPFCPQDPGKV